MEKQGKTIVNVRYEKPEIIDLGSTITIQGGAGCNPGSIASTTCTGGSRVGDPPNCMTGIGYTPPCLTGTGYIPT
ncbi:MAG: hypothetical protein BWY63_02363 [Chloroflexi bacterium ADurb.Bin360]|nr:MAG: hypothetical protein BWY63_02363 [Chloroflexi bacterium ADurb.Bin360]